jgi:hypothetical protein
MKEVKKYCDVRKVQNGFVLTANDGDYSKSIEIVVEGKLPELGTWLGSWMQNMFPEYLSKISFIVNITCPDDEESSDDNGLPF